MPPLPYSKFIITVHSLYRLNTIYCLCILLLHWLLLKLFNPLPPHDPWTTLTPFSCQCFFCPLVLPSPLGMHSTVFLFSFALPILLCFNCSFPSPTPLYCPALPLTSTMMFCFLFHMTLSIFTNHDCYVFVHIQDWFISQYYRGVCFTSKNIHSMCIWYCIISVVSKIYTYIITYVLTVLDV